MGTSVIPSVGSWSIKINGNLVPGITMQVSNASATGFSYSYGIGNANNGTATENSSSQVSGLKGPAGQAFTGSVTSSTKMSGSFASPADAETTWEADWQSNPDPLEECPEDE
jgi:hypothetical protein